VTAGVVALDIHDQGSRRRDRPAHHTGTLQPETLGVGIQGMRERIRQLGGTFAVEFTDKGTTVSVRVSLKEVP
jgi:signal transduction histidine kinase